MCISDLTGVKHDPIAASLLAGATHGAASMGELESGYFQDRSRGYTVLQRVG